MTASAAAELADEPRIGLGVDWLVDAADLLAEPDPGPTPWLVQDLIVEHAIVAAVGRWKTTKSFALLDICISIATGLPAFGVFEVPSPGPVVFINEESGRAALWRRLDALCRGRAIDPELLRGRLHVAANANVKLDDPARQAELVDIGRHLQPRLFVFDPLARMKAAARDENAQADMAVLIEFVRHLRDVTGAGALFVHHTGHAGVNMRGSSDLESVWESRLTWTRDGQSPLVTLTAEHREAEAADPLQYRIAWDATTRSMRFNGERSESSPPLAELVTAWLRENPKSKARDVAKGVGVRATDVDRVLEELTTGGHLKLGRSGRVDTRGREIRDQVYTLNHDLSDGSSQTLFSDPHGTGHGTSHDAASQSRTSHDHHASDSAQPCAPVPRPDNGTKQDEPPAAHRGSVPRPPF